VTAKNQLFQQISDIVKITIPMPLHTFRPVVLADVKTPMAMDVPIANNAHKNKVTVLERMRDNIQMVTANIKTPIMYLVTFIQAPVLGNHFALDIPTINNGTPMPSLKDTMTDTEAWCLVDYVRSLKKAVPRDDPYPTSLQSEHYSLKSGLDKATSQRFLDFIERVYRTCQEIIPLKDSKRLLSLKISASREAFMGGRYSIGNCRSKE